MAWLSAIFTFFSDLLGIGKLIEKYFPPKTTEQKIEEGRQDVDQKIEDELSSGRPK